MTTAKRKKPLALRLLQTVFLVVVSFYGLNALLISGLTPVFEANSGVADHAHGVLANDLSIRPLGVPVASPAGYVNMAEEDARIYVDPSVRFLSERLRDDFYSHETAHLQQKALVAKVSGGYPSYENPLVSMVYFANLLRLNSELADFMPPLPADVPTLLSGLEAAADCHATPTVSYSAPTAFHRGAYLQDAHCSAEQRAIALQVAAGEWPHKPLAAELAPSNLSTDVSIMGPQDKDYCITHSFFTEEERDFIEDYCGESSNVVREIKRLAKD